MQRTILDSTAYIYPQKFGVLVLYGVLVLCSVFLFWGTAWFDRGQHEERVVTSADNFRTPKWGFTLTRLIIRYDIYDNNYNNNYIYI